MEETEFKWPSKEELVSKRATVDGESITEYIIVSPETNKCYSMMAPAIHIGGHPTIKEAVDAKNHWRFNEFRIYKKTTTFELLQDKAPDLKFDKFSLFNLTGW